MGAMASQITFVQIVYSTICSGADQRKHKSSASLEIWQEWKSYARMWIWLIYKIPSTFNGNLVIYFQILNAGTGFVSGKVNSFQLNPFSLQNGSVAAAICRMAQKLGKGGSGTVDAWFKGKHRSCWATETCINWFAVLNNVYANNTTKTKQNKQKYLSKTKNNNNNKKKNPNIQTNKKTTNEASIASGTVI